MKIKSVLVSLILFLLLPSFVLADEYGFVIESYHIDMIVNDDNSFDIKETLMVNFLEGRHGIYRDIPLKNKIVRADGSTATTRAKISINSINQPYQKLSITDGMRLKIGNPSVKVTGLNEYIIEYNYDLGREKNKGFDELYLDLIGVNWGVEIKNITFTITMPKSFDEEKLGFPTGGVGNVTNTGVKYTVDDKVIQGYYDGVLLPGEGISIRLELPDEYFDKATTSVTPVVMLMFIVPITGLLLCLLLWHRFGNDEETIETIEFYPPEGINVLDVAYIYKGYIESSDVTSLLVTLANKGYIMIEDKKKKESIFANNSFKIVKLKDYDGSDQNEAKFMEGLFKNSKTETITYKHKKLETKTVTRRDLVDRFYKTINEIVRTINKRKDGIYFEKQNSSKRVIVFILIMLSVITIYLVPVLDYYGNDVLTQALFGFFMFMLMGLSWFFSSEKVVAKIINVVVMLFIFLIMFQSYGLLDSLLYDSIYLAGVSIGMLCVIGMMICFWYMPKRTVYGNELYGRIKGFKNYLMTAEKERIEGLVVENPTYFYDILPYVYVLNVSDKWMKNFESIAVEKPDWYHSSMKFDSNGFSSSLDNTLSSINSSMISSPSSSGGSGGGGSSGGGSGGGGGGSW